MDKVINWFATASREDIGYSLIALGVIIGIIGITIRIKFISFGLGGLLVVIGLCLVLANC